MMTQFLARREHLCGYDLNLTYPQNGHFPTLHDPFQGEATTALLAAPSRSSKIKSLLAALKTPQNDAAAASLKSLPLNRREIARREERRQVWKRSLAGRVNGTIDPYYGCFLFDEMWDYAFNFTFPWTNGGIDVYNIPDALNPEVPSDASVFLNGV